MITDNQIVTVQKGKLPNSCHYRKETGEGNFECIHVIANGMVRVNGELFTVFHIKTGMQHPVKLLCR